MNSMILESVTNSPHPSPDPGDPIRLIVRVVRPASTRITESRLISWNWSLSRQLGGGGSSDIRKSQLRVPSSDGSPASTGSRERRRPSDQKMIRETKGSPISEHLEGGPAFRAGGTHEVP